MMINEDNESTYIFLQISLLKTFFEKCTSTTIKRAHDVTENFSRYIVYFYDSSVSNNRKTS